MTLQLFLFTILIAGGAWILLVVISGLMGGKYRLGGKVFPSGVATSVVFAMIGTFYTVVLLGLVVACTLIYGFASL